MEQQELIDKVDNFYEKNGLTLRDKYFMSKILTDLYYDLIKSEGEDDEEDDLDDEEEEDDFDLDNDNEKDDLDELDIDLDEKEEVKPKSKPKLDNHKKIDIKNIINKPKVKIKK